MKLDLELVREILLAAEAHKHGFIDKNPSIPEYTNEQVDYHVYIMKQDGLVEAMITTDADSLSPSALISNLTNKGHEFVRLSESSKTWGKAKEAIVASGVSITLTTAFEMLKSLANSYLKFPS